MKFIYKKTILILKHFSFFMSSIIMNQFFQKDSLRYFRKCFIKHLTCMFKKFNFFYSKIY